MKKTIKPFLILFVLFLSFNPIFSQAQLGSDIDGEAEEDQSGWPVIMAPNGNRVIIGAPFNDGNGPNAGHARVYEKINAEWIQLGDDIDGAGSGDEFGRSVSISFDGTRVAIGAPKHDAGYAQVYQLDGGSWVQVGDDINGEASGDNFGGSGGLTAGPTTGAAVSMSWDGNRVAIGAPGNDGNGMNSGHVRVFELVNGTWEQMGDDIDGESSQDNSGATLSLSAEGTRIVIGAPFNDGNSVDAGHARVYDWDGTNWAKTGNDINGIDPEGLAGGSVAISANGNRVAIGAPIHGQGIDFWGQVQVFELIDGHWEQIGTSLTGAIDHIFSGWSVSLSGDGSRLVIGTPAHTPDGGYYGRTQIFDFEDGDWVQNYMDIYGENSWDFAGHSVSISANGNRVAIGSKHNSDNGTSSGHVRIYDLEPLQVSEVSSNMEHEVKFFPNPTNGKIEITGREYETIEILDSFGTRIGDVRSFKPQIDISEFPDGIYFLRLGQSGNFISKRIVKI